MRFVQLPLVAYSFLTPIDRGGLGHGLRPLQETQSTRYPSEASIGLFIDLHDSAKCSLKLFVSITVRVNNATVQGVSHQPITYYALSAFSVNGSLPVYAISNDTSVPDDACEVLPASTPDLSEFVVIVRRGSCVFAEKLTNLAAKGAKYVLIYE